MVPLSTDPDPHLSNQLILQNIKRSVSQNQKYQVTLSLIRVHLNNRFMTKSRNLKDKNQS
ncbi:hypothetical protein SAMN05192551_106126 [Tindallia magadiensis]|uniref:Uncharacterized protein n=1 Tax=Tindallia magadiensis TaxID=69895 RepID=A0A1I3FEF1_9FIRM|nr:hypothetical protein SAMN05192551_106126 [Tindallia magadiensis]